MNTNKKGKKVKMFRHYWDDCPGQVKLKEKDAYSSVHAGGGMLGLVPRDQPDVCLINLSMFLGCSIPRLGLVVL